MYNKLVLIIASISICFAYSCNSSVSDNVKSLPFQDSFGVEAEGVNTTAMQFLDSNNIIATNIDGNELIRLQREGQKFRKVQVQKLKIEGRVWNIYITKSSDILLLTFDRGIYRVNRNFDQLKKITNCMSLQNLGKRYCFAAYQQFPIIENSGKLLLTLFQRAMVDNDYELYLKSRIFSEVSCNNDTMIITKELVEKDENLSQFRFPYPTYCYNDGIIYYIYNCYDTLYQYNISRDVVEKKYIGNRFYSRPQRYDYTKGLDLSNPSYNLRYNAQNFCYRRIIMNDLNKHILFVFSAPEENGNNKISVYGMVVDENLKLLKYYSMGDYYPGEEYSIYKLGLNQYAIKQLTEENEKIYYTFSF